MNNIFQLNHRVAPPPHNRGNVSLLISAAFLAFCGTPLKAAEIGYTAGSASNLQNSLIVGSFSLSNVFAPAFAQTTPSDTNTINIEYVPDDAGLNDPSFVLGGYSVKGDVTVTGNTVNLINGAVTYGGIIGGLSSTGKVTKNKVNISGGTVGFVYGGASDGSASNSVATNYVNISGGAVGSVYGGISTYGVVTDNHVNISGGTVDDVVFGGYSYAAVIGNHVNISGGTMGDAVFGGRSFEDKAIGNHVTISGGTVGYVFGGFSNADSATGNTVIISGGTISGAIYGGFSLGTAAVTGNVVTISGSPTFNSSNTALYGGYGDGGDLFSGNTLNILSVIASPVASVQNFEKLNFTLPTHIADGATLLTATGAVVLGNNSDKGSLVGIKLAGTLTNLNIGETVKLIHSNNTGISGTLATRSTSAAVHSGLRISTYSFEIGNDTSDLFATLTAISPPTLNPQTKALSEAQVAGLAFLTQGQDLAGTQGTRLLRENVLAGAQAFLASSYSDYRYETGSHVNVRGANFLAGPAWGKRLENADLALGAFIEAGEGNYNTSNTFDTLPAVRGHGHTRYYGIGLLGSLEQDSGLFVDGSLRIGRIDTDFKSRDISDQTGASAKYDSGSLYYGAQANLGYAFKPNDKTRLEAYTRFSWARQESDSVRVLGDKVRFSAIDSQRLRGGLRYVYSASENFTPYVGIAYEHEFDGKSKAKTLGDEIDAPGLKGGTTIAELGFTYRATKTSPFSVNFGLQGYAGKREGGGGSFRLDYRF